MAAPPEDNDFITRVGLYILGTLVGLGAKLATMNNTRKLQTKEIIMHSFVAMAAAWAVWWVLHDKIPDSMANAFAVVVGRFGDSILLAIYKAFKVTISKQMNNDNE